MTMPEVRAGLRAGLGRVGVWTFALDGLPAGGARETVGEIERLGYPVLWFPEGLSSREAFTHASLLLDASERIVVATGIANVAARDPVAMANGAMLLADDHPGRFVLGVGIGHGVTTEVRGGRWQGPLSRMRTYLERMDDAPSSAPEPARRAPRMLAALGPKMLALAAERTAGAHTYFVPVSHTAIARDVLGPDPVLAVEQAVVLDTDPSRARRIARGFAIEYLQLPNYANNLRRLGFSEEDLSGEGSDALIDATVAWGGADAIRKRVAAHLDAGADHVCVQVITEDASATGVRELRELAPALLDL